jgi:hypothetical protein
LPKYAEPRSTCIHTGQKRRIPPPEGLHSPVLGRHPGVRNLLILRKRPAGLSHFRPPELISRNPPVPGFRNYRPIENPRILPISEVSIAKARTSRRQWTRWCESPIQPGVPK